MDKYRAVSWVQRSLNHVVRPVLLHGISVPGYAVLETTGRKSGQPRHTPLGGALVGDTFWLVSEHGRRSAYVLNLEANPQVRVRVGSRWRSGIAQPLPDDDAHERLRLLSRGRPGYRLNALAARAVGTDLLTIRVDLDDE